MNKKTRIGFNGRYLSSTRFLNNTTRRCAALLFLMTERLSCCGGCCLTWLGSLRFACLAGTNTHQPHNTLYNKSRSTYSASVMCCVLCEIVCIIWLGCVGLVVTVTAKRERRDRSHRICMRKALRVFRTLFGLVCSIAKSFAGRLHIYIVFEVNSFCCI